MQNFIVHTSRQEAGVHFFYRVTASKEGRAFDKLQKRGAIDEDETHVETIEIPEGGDEHELIAIFMVNQKQDDISELIRS